MTKIYIGGSLFSEAEIAQRLKEEDKLRELYGETVDIFNPITAPCNDKNSLPTALSIFEGDTDQILSSDVMLVDISNQSDAGVFTELGIAWACNFVNSLANGGMSLSEVLEVMKPKHIVTHLSDIRKGTSHRYEGNYIPWGFNQYAIGCVQNADGKIADSLQEALVEIGNRVPSSKNE